MVDRSFAYAEGEMSTEASTKGTVVAVTTVDAIAKVIKSDQTQRTVTIKDPEGKKVTISMPPARTLHRVYKTQADQHGGPIPPHHSLMRSTIEHRAAVFKPVPANGARS